LARTLLLVWEAADWPAVTGLIDDGRLPNLARLRRRGLGGALNTPAPLEPIAVLTTLATGKPATEHGIFSAFNAGSDSIDPVSAHDLDSPTLWQILATKGLSAGALNWPLTYPVNHTCAVEISEPFFRPLLGEGQVRRPPQGSVHPEDWLEALDEFRLHASDMSGAELASLVPEAGKIDQKRDQRLATIAVKLAETVTTQNIINYCLERQSWNFLCARFSALDQIGRVFGGLSSLAEFTAQEDSLDQVVYGPVLVHFYEMLDLMLGHLVGQLGDEGTVMVVSPHGMRYQPLDPSRRLSARELYRPQGFLCAAGPDVRPDGELLGASVLDVVPTVLRLCGQVEAHDMPGRPLAEAFEFDARPSTVATWDSCPVAPERSADSSVLRSLLIEQGLPIPDRPERLHLQVAMSTAESLAERGATSMALAELQALDSESARSDPEYLRMMAHLTLDLGDSDRAESLLRDLMQNGGKPFDEGLLRARIHTARGQHEHALKSLFEILVQHPSQAIIHLFIGDEYRHLGRLQEALDAYANVLDLDSNHLRARLGRTEVLLEQGDHAAAVDSALDAVECRFTSPGAHRLLGRALEAQGQWAQAADAYTACLNLNSHDLETQAALMRLYEPDRLDRPEELNRQRQRYSRLLARQAVSDH